MCFFQIQTVKTQELNLLREQILALNSELQQRRTEHESFLAQKDDLNSQLQVFWHINYKNKLKGFFQNKMLYFILNHCAVILLDNITFPYPLQKSQLFRILRKSVLMKNY